MRLTWYLGTCQPRDLLPYFANLFKIYGPVVHVNLAGHSYVLLNDPEDIQILLSSYQHIQKGTDYVMLKPWLNDGLLLSTGAKWQSRRKLLTNTFHFKTINLYIPFIYKHSLKLVDKLLVVSETGKKINLMEYVTLCSLDIICETIMGVNINAQEGKSIEYVTSIKSACRSVIERIFKFWLWNNLLFAISQCGRTFYKSINVLHAYTDNVIKIKKEQKIIEDHEVLADSKHEKKIKKSFLDILLNILEDHQEHMSDEDIREEVNTFLFEGHDTSSIAMTMTLILLGIYQDIQDRVRDELFSIFGDSDREVNMEDLNAMKYLDAVIKESLRLYPSVPAFTRQLQTTLNLKNYSIPPLTTLTIYPYILHRNEDIYSEPEEFIPERFLDEANQSKFVFGYLPFSAGARNCIGQKFAMHQMKTVISTILRNMKIETLGSREDIQISMQIVLRIESLPYVKFHKI